jgi:hypothetical protein
MKKLADLYWLTIWAFVISDEPVEERSYTMQLQNRMEALVFTNCTHL